MAKQSVVIKLRQRICILGNKFSITRLSIDTRFEPREALPKDCEIPRTAATWRNLQELL